MTPPAEEAPRVACLLVPDLPLVAELRAHPELGGGPFAVASGAEARAELISVSPEAAACGVRRGRTVAHARTLCGDLQIRVASPALEQAARDALLDAALSGSPRAVLAPRRSGPFGVEAAAYLDARGMGALYPSEAGFAAALGAGARALGLPAHVGLASSRGVAHVAARALGPGGDQVRVLPPGGEAAFLAPLPIDILDPEDAVAEALTRFGVHRVRDLLALPRRGLGRRLGPGVLALVALARGTRHEPPLPAPAELRLVEAIDLDHPVDRLQPLLFVLQGLLSRLLDRLETRHLGCGDLALGLELAEGGRDARRLAVAAPSRDLRVLLRLVHHALESRPPPAPVLGARIETRGRAVRSDQLDLFRPAGPAPAVLGETLAALESLCGEARVGAPVVADDHHPDALGMTPFAPRPRGTGASAVDAAPDERRSACAGALRALRPPVAAQVRIRNHRPEWIRSAVANGHVVHLAGPWRTTGGWWTHESRFAFDSFDVQTSDGTVARLRLDHVRRSWHIDAIYD